MSSEETREYLAALDETRETYVRIPLHVPAGRAGSGLSRMDRAFAQDAVCRVGGIIAERVLSYRDPEQTVTAWTERRPLPSGLEPGEYRHTVNGRLVVGFCKVPNCSGHGNLHAQDRAPRMQDSGR